MASRSNRQRKLERARAERRVARQAHRLRRKRQIQAGVGASIALVLIVLGTTWLLGGFDSKPAERQTVAEGTCSWTLKDAAADPAIVDVGHPPTTGEERSGMQTMTIKTNLGDIEAEIDLSKAPCTAVSMGFLGEKKFYEGSVCHRLSAMSKLLTCGDPRGDGSGSPSYQFADENLPAAPLASASPSAGASPSASPSGPATYYAKGTIVMVNTGANTNGGQFSVIYADGSNLAPAYSIVGRVTKGLGIVEGVAKAGAVDDKGASTAEGKPNQDLIIQQLFVGAAPGASPSVTPSASAPATAQS